MRRVHSDQRAPCERDIHDVARLIYVIDLSVCFNKHLYRAYGTEFISNGVVLIGGDICIGWIGCSYLNPINPDDATVIGPDLERQPERFDLHPAAQPDRSG